MSNMSSLRPFAPSYLVGAVESLPFLPLDFRNPEDRRKAVMQAAQRSCEPALVDVLRAQHQRRGASPAQLSHLEALAQPGTAVVVTGQQVGLFLGPLYTFYKAATSVAVARALQAETGQTVVPLFWLQTEDHDFPEIGSTFVPQTGQEPLRLTVEDTAPETPRISIAHRHLGASVQAALAQLSAVLDGLPHAASVMAWLQEHYHPEQHWGDAFAGALSACFADDGLLLLDPRDPGVASLTRHVHQRAIEGMSDINAVLSTRAQELEQAGFQVQVPVREDCCLNFFHPAGVTGDRFRLQPVEGGWGLAGATGTFTTAELLEVLQRSPLQFSSSALLRPFLQDHLLPTAAYVGGPGELAYLAQLAPLYRWFGLDMPLAMPRGRFVLVDHKSRSNLDAWQLSVDALLQSEDALLAQIQAGQTQEFSPDAIRSRLWGAFQQSLHEISERLVALEPGLHKSIDKTARSVEGLIDKLVQKVERVQLHQDQQLVQQLRTVRERLVPQGVPQERVFGVPYFAARYGLDSLKQLVYQAYKPFSATVQELSL